MDKDIYTTDVIFRKFKDGDILALFPGQAGDMSVNTCGSYQHVGQHGAASIDIMRDTLPATVDEYMELFAELESIGYKLRIVHKFTPRHTTARQSQL